MPVLAAKERKLIVCPDSQMKESIPSGRLLTKAMDQKICVLNFASTLLVLSEIGKRLTWRKTRKKYKNLRSKFLAMHRRRLDQTLTTK